MKDIKTRKIPNLFWIILGLIGISLIEIQIVFEHGIGSVQYIISLTPLMVLFMSFLICDGVVDRESGNHNIPWIYLIILAVFVFAYLFLFNPFNDIEYIENIYLLGPTTFLLIYFMIIQYTLGTLEEKAYKNYQEVLKKKIKLIKMKNAKTKMGTKVSEYGSKKGMDKKDSVEKEYETDPDSIEYNNIVDEQASWALFFGLLAFVIIIFIIEGFMPVILGKQIGLIILIIIPIKISIFYYIYQNSNAQKLKDVKEEKRSYGSKNNIDEFDDHDYDIEIELHELQYKPPSKALIQLLFSSLVVFGFIILIYYGTLELFSNILLQNLILIVWILIFYGFYNLGIPRGGADTKALMALVIVFPIYPVFEYLTINNSFFIMLEDFPVTGYIFPFAFTILMNAAFIMIFFIIMLVIYNGTRRDLKIPNALLGYQIPINQVSKKFVWLMELVIDGKRKVQPFPKEDVDLKVELKKFKELGIKRVWVTPKVPFIVPMTIGLIIGCIVGNIIFLLISILM